MCIRDSTDVAGTPDSNVELICTGGVYRANTRSFIGPDAENFIRNMVPDKVFIAANGFSTRYGATTPNLTEASIKRVMIEAGKEVYLAVDSGKTGKDYFSAVSYTHLMKFNDAVHEKGMKTYWIPYWNASGTSSAHNYGCDATALQPNHFFTYRANQSAYLPGTMAEPVKNGNPLMDTFAFRIKTLGLGAEFEIEGDAFTQAIKYNVLDVYKRQDEEFAARIEEEMNRMRRR